MSRRARLAILYAVVLFAASAVVVAIPNLFFAGRSDHAEAPSRASGAEPAATQHVAAVHPLLGTSLIALAVMLVVSIALGWFGSGWTLRRAVGGPTNVGDGNYGMGGSQ